MRFVKRSRDEGDVAERAARRRAGLVRAEPLVLQPLDLELYVRGDFGGEVVGVAAAAEHASALDRWASSTRAIAPARRFHLLVSFASCLRPAAVRE